MLWHLSKFPALLRWNSVIVCICHILLTHSHINRHVSCFHVLATLNNVAVNRGVKNNLFFGHAVGMRDLSSLTRDRTRGPCSGSAES